jgi:hypothetical protein
MASANGITVTAHSVCESDCLEGGLDVTVDVTLDGEERQGEVTLTPDPINGGWVAYGDCADTWVESGLLIWLCRTAGDHAASPALRSILGEIEAVAVRAAEAR